MQASTGAARARKLAIDPEEWKARVDLAAAFRLAALQNWDELLFAHLSARVPGHPKQFLMHPAAILFEEVTASNLHKLDENCNHVEPSDEIPHKFAFPFHKGIYDAFPQAQCVMEATQRRSRFEMPPRDIRSPANTKNGTASSAYSASTPSTMTHCACGKAS